MDHKKQPENRGVFETTQVAKLSTKSKRLGIGRVTNQNQSETIFMGVVENSKLDHIYFNQSCETSKQQETVKLYPKTQNVLKDQLDQKQPEKLVF